MPIIDTPFERVAVDLVRPIFPPTERGNKYILNMMDYVTKVSRSSSFEGHSS